MHRLLTEFGDHDCSDQDANPSIEAQATHELEDSTKDCTGGVFNICLNYGGQAEIVDATKKIVSLVQEGKLNIDDLNTENYY